MSCRPLKRLSLQSEPREERYTLTGRWHADGGYWSVWCETYSLGCLWLFSWCENCSSQSEADAPLTSEIVGELSRWRHLRCDLVVDHKASSAVHVREFVATRSHTPLCSTSSIPQGSSERNLWASHRACYLCRDSSNETRVYIENWPSVTGWKSNECYKDEKTHRLAAADPWQSWMRCLSHIGPKP